MHGRKCGDISEWRGEGSVSYHDGGGYGEGDRGHGIVVRYVVYFTLQSCFMLHVLCLISISPYLGIMYQSTNGVPLLQITH